MAFDDWLWSLFDLRLCQLYVPFQDSWLTGLDLQLSIKVNPDAYELDTGFIPVVRKVKTSAGPSDTKNAAVKSENIRASEKKVAENEDEQEVVKSNGQGERKRS